MNTIIGINPMHYTFGAKRMDKKVPKNFQEQIDKTIDKITARVEKEVPESGEFTPVREYFDNLNPETENIVGKYGLQVYKMPQNIVPDPTKRYVEAAAYVPSGEYKADQIVVSGNNKEIIAKLKEDGFGKKLNIIFGQLLDTIKHQ